jgi:hypothetical protein
MNITEDMLLAAGYKFYRGVADLKNADAFYQKTVWEGSVKLYFIDVYYYRFTHLNDATFEAIQYLPNEIGITVRVSASQFDSITEIENLLDHLYHNNGFVADPHNQST